MGRGSFKAEKGLIKVDVIVRNGMIKKIQISGDFFMYPEDCLWRLEEALIGVSSRREDILLKIRSFYEENDLLTPGVVPEDFTEAIVRAIGVVAS